MHEAYGYLQSELVSEKNNAIKVSTILYMPCIVESSGTIPIGTTLKLNDWLSWIRAQEDGSIY